MRRIAWIGLCMLILIAFYRPPSIGNALQTDDVNLIHGPYIDAVRYNVIPDRDEQIYAMLARDIHIIHDYLSPQRASVLATEPNIDLFEALQNGYYQISINCRDYPLNLSSFRRAFAYAYDKDGAVRDIAEDFAEPLDSVVPAQSFWSAEEEFDWHYYSAQPEIGNQILDSSGFEINSTTGYRHAPNGDPLLVTIDYYDGEGYASQALAELGVEALQSIHVNAETNELSWYEFYQDLSSHEFYDMIVYQWDFHSYDINWLAYYYWSEFADIAYQNPTAFRNLTFDLWRDALLYGTTLEQVEEAAREMQKVLHYNVPNLVIFQNKFIQPYRTDVFVGQVRDYLGYISTHWSFRNMYQKIGEIGGIVEVAIREEPDSFNFFVSNQILSDCVSSCMWPSLYRRGPDMSAVGDLALNLITETHSDNPAVPDDHTRFTIDIIHNATWSDGTPLTAEDVVFSQVYAFESTVFGNPAGSVLGDLVVAYAPTPYRAVVEFSTESYWHFSDFAYDSIIPEHIFNDETGIGYDGWNTWNPVFDPTEPFVTCGPFIIEEYVKDDHFQLAKNPDFYYVTTELPPIAVTTNNGTTIIQTTTSQTGTNTTLENLIPMVSIAVSISATVTIITCIILIRQHRATTTKSEN